MQWYTSGFHCVSWKPGTRINLLRKMSTDYRENSSNSHAEIFEQGHHLFIDNYNTSISVAEYLMQNGTYVMGTIREHRKHFLVEMKAMRIEQGDAAFYQHKDVVVAKYRAKKVRSNGKAKEVYVLSTAHAPAMGHTNNRDKDGTSSLNQPVSYLTITYG